MEAFKEILARASELKELDNLDTENDDGWAGAQSEVDYTEKLNFSDEDEGTSTQKDEEESWDEQISKAEQLGTKTSESFNGPKEINECPGNKTSSNESATLPAASQSPTKISSVRSLQTDRQESGRSAVQAVVRELRGLGNTSVNQKPAPQHPPPPNRQIGPGKYAAAKPLLPSDSDEAWRQRRKPSMSDLSAAVERARKRREEEERRMEEQRLAACAAKLKKLDEKYGTLSKERKENAKEKDKMKRIEKEGTKDIEKENTKGNENDKANRKENESEKWKETEKQQEKEQEQEKVAEQQTEKEPEKKEHEKKEQEEQQGQEEKIDLENVLELEQPQQQEQEQETEKEEEKDEVEREPEQRQEEPPSEPDDFKGQKEEDDLKKTE
eukprot:g42420.t1